MIRILLLAIPCLSALYAVAQKTDNVYYSSLNRAIHLGQLEGVATVAQAKAHGDFAVGSSHQLATELVMLDGKPYGISADGSVRLLNGNETLPFAAVKFFKAEDKHTVRKQLSLERLHSYLDSVLDKNRFAAIKISGMFTAIEHQCFYKQTPPYKPTKELETKKTTQNNVRGTIAGFYTPKSALVLNSPQYHFHFIDNARKAGGHVISCTIKDVTIEIDYATGFEVKLPPAGSTNTIDLDKPIEAER